MSRILGISLSALLVMSCTSSEDIKEASVSSKVRSTGLTSSLSLVEMADQAQTQLTTLAGMRANSAFSLDYFKVPIRRINLVSGLFGTGYTSASPNFYTCDSTKTETECLVDLSQGITVDNLLTGGTDGGTVAVESEIDYNGVSIEFCPDGSSGATFSARVKGSVKLASTTYYTNAANGLSITGPAEEASIKISCGGVTTPLATAVTLGPDKTISIVVYADPNGNVFATNYKTLANSNCTGEDTLAVCTSYPAIFSTVDTATPTVERYFLDVQDTKDGNPYADMLLKMVINSSDEPIGIVLQENYVNLTTEKLLHTPLFALTKAEKNADGTYNLQYSTSGATTLTNLIKNFKRGTATGLKLESGLSETAATFNVKKL